MASSFSTKEQKEKKKKKEVILKIPERKSEIRSFFKAD